MQIVFHGQTFESVKTRRNGTQVFVNADRTRFLRVGPVAAIMKELAFHRSLIVQGFPVPRILEDGPWEDGHYFLESSVGEEHYGLIFGTECRTLGAVQTQTLDRFFQVVHPFVSAQRQTSMEAQNWESVFLGAHVDFLLQERPREARMMARVWEKIRTDLAGVPFTLCHGDFNAYNILPDGAIDFETAFEGPLGYDFVSAMTATEWFPADGDFEIKQSYRLARPHVERFVDEWQTVSGTPLLKTFDALFMLRAAWVVVRMEKTPKLQAWRYERFDGWARRFLEGQSVYQDWLAKIA